ncbi:MAG TPA: hypothetical protein VI409_15375 [Gaiellaceae bacterium]|nr:hypothetical protein [Gaiellaceae bacterium]
MRCSGWSSLAISVCSGLALAAPAAAHVTVVPPFVSAGDTATLSLTGPNEREAEMTGFAVTVPSEFRIVEARSADSWRSAVQGTTATWQGDSLASGAEATFTLEVEGPVGPGPAVLEAAQLYPGGEIVRWTVALTVTPAAETPSQNLGWALVTALAGLVVISGIGVAVLRRTRSLQER